MKNINKQIINNLITENYKSKEIFDKSICFYMNDVLIESGGISSEVVKETNRLINSVLKELPNAKQYSLDNGIAQYKFSFYDKLFNEDFKLSVSIINYRYEEIWLRKKHKYTPNNRASISKEKKLIILNIDAIGMELQPQTFENSLQHEIQHYYDVNKSEYSWANDNTYKMAQELINTQNNITINDEALRERLYMLGMMFYLSFKQEQSGFANGLYAFLKHCGYKLNRNNIDRLSHSDESFSAIRLLQILSDVLSGMINDDKIIHAINYINKTYNKNYTLQILSKKCDKILRDFVKRVNRAKSEALYPNDIYECYIPKINDYLPLNFKR